MKTPKLGPRASADTQGPELPEDEIRAFMATLDRVRDHTMIYLCEQALQPRPADLSWTLWYGARCRVREAIDAQGAPTARSHVRRPRDITARMPPAAIHTLPPAGMATQEMEPPALPPVPTVEIPAPVGPLPRPGQTGHPHRWGVMLEPVPDRPGMFYAPDPCACPHCARVNVYDPAALPEML